MNEDELIWAMTVLEEDKAASFGYFKRELEAVIGRTLEPTEAQTFYEMAKKELA